ncbi:MAG: hypothetical protein LBI13_02815 [Streptococcaceae bacterium]|jgi:hypothetical protein|nr:hypothetical protein [Streptococcaceae bacterium]
MKKININNCSELSEEDLSLIFGGSSDAFWTGFGKGAHVVWNVLKWPF